MLGVAVVVVGWSVSLWVVDRVGEAFGVSGWLERCPGVAGVSGGLETSVLSVGACKRTVGLAEAGSECVGDAR